MTTDRYDCCSCGACCHSEFDGDPFVDVDDKEALRIPFSLVEESAAGYRMRVRHNVCGNTVCAALKQHGDRCSCSIYSIRPNVCRNFKPGCRECKEARRALFVEED